MAITPLRALQSPPADRTNQRFGGVINKLNDGFEHIPSKSSGQGEGLSDRIQNCLSIHKNLLGIGAVSLLSLALFRKRLISLFAKEAPRSLRTTTQPSKGENLALYTRDVHKINIKELISLLEKESSTSISTAVQAAKRRENLALNAYKVNGKEVLPYKLDKLALNELKEGDTLQIKDILYIMSVDKQGKLVPFELRGWAHSVSELFPSGIHNLNPDKIDLPGLEEFWNPNEQHTKAEKLKEFLNLIQESGYHPLKKSYEITDRQGQRYKFCLLDNNTVIRGGRPIENRIMVENEGIMGDPGYRMLQFAIAEKKGLIPESFWR